MYDECPHSVQAFQTLRAPLEIAVKQDLGVAGRAERMASRLQLPAQFDEVVNLAVEDQGDGTVDGAHRLVASRRQVENRQAPEPERYLSREVSAFVIGPPMRQNREHSAHDFLVLARRWGFDNADESAHRLNAGI